MYWYFYKLYRRITKQFLARSICVNLNTEVGDSVISMPHCFQALAERLAENSHDLWAKTKKQELEEIGKQSEKVQADLLVICFSISQA